MNTEKANNTEENQNSMDEAIHSVEKYYLNAEKKAKGRKYFIHWNWSAFLFTFSWMAYRNMLLKAVFLSFVFAIVMLSLLAAVLIVFKNVFEINCVIENMRMNGKIISYVIMIFEMLLFGLYGTSYYLCNKEKLNNKKKYLHDTKVYKIFVLFIVNFLNISITAILMGLIVKFLA